jgi:hypothetical protein
LFVSAVIKITIALRFMFTEIAFTGTPVTDIKRAQKVVRIFGR